MSHHFHPFSLLCGFLVVIPIVFSQELAKQRCSDYYLMAKRMSNFRPPSIIGGYESADDEFPHMVALGYGPKWNLQWHCGGTLINEQYVLTAAHCLVHRTLGPVKIAHLGSRYLESGGKLVEISKAIQHPNYKTPSQYNDIALIKLRRPVRYSKSIFPACLNTVFDVRPRSSKLAAIGWGQTDFGGDSSETLMKVQLDLYTHKECQESYQNVPKRRLRDGIRNSSQICAGGRTKMEDTCQGDSGSPLEMKIGGLHAVVGITSFGKACGFGISPGVYTRVSAFVPWIENTIWGSGSNNEDYSFGF